MFASSRPNNLPLILGLLVVSGLIGFLAYSSGKLVATRSPTVTLAILVAIFVGILVLWNRSFIIYAFIAVACMPAFLTQELVMVRGVNLVNFFWIVMVLFVFLNPAKIRNIQFTRLDKNVLLLVALMFISCLRGTISYGLTLNDWLYSFAKPLQFILLYAAIYNHFSSKQDIKPEISKILLANIAIAAALAVFMLLAHKAKLDSGLTYEYARTGGLWVFSPNLLTLFFIFNILFILVLLETLRKPSVRIFLISALVLLLLGIVFSYTRTAYFAVILAAVCYYLLNKKKIKMIFVILLFGMIIPFLPQTVVERSQSLAEVNDGEIVPLHAVTLRSHYIYAGTMYLIDNPLKLAIGGGLGDYEHNAYRYSTSRWLQGGYMRQGRDPHNFWMRHLCEVGVLGLGIIALFYRKIYRLGKELAQRSQDLFSKKLSVVMQTQLVVYLVYTMSTSPLLMWEPEPQTIALGSLLGCLLLLHSRLLSHDSPGINRTPRT